MTDFECIIIDDGSTDGSSKIIDDYAKLDSRFVAIHQNNLGVGAARNSGLKTASGTFVTFVDSDDKVSPVFLENMLCSIGDQDILITGFTICKTHKYESIGTVKGLANIETMAKGIKEGLLNSCWGKLFRKSAIENICFPNNILWGEDTVFLMKCMCQTEKIVFDTIHGYYYTYSLDGLANRFDIRKPYYLGVYYKQLILFSRHWDSSRSILYDEVCIKISQEIMRTIDILLKYKLLYKDEKAYFCTLFGNTEVNEMFIHGLKMDVNPRLIRIIANFHSIHAWHIYLRIRRIVRDI